MTDVKTAFSEVSYRPMSLHGKKTILAVSGGIAAFKALSVTRLLRRHGADPYVVMTEHATRFIAPASFPCGRVIPLVSTSSRL